MKSLKFIFPCITLCFLAIYSCSDDDSGDSGNTDSFDRQAMLVGWADDIIIPAY
jgi:hypothetical protein